MKLDRSKHQVNLSSIHSSARSASSVSNKVHYCMLTMAAARPSLVFLLFLASSALSLLFVSVSSAVFASLDCGSSSTTTDDKFMVWLADDQYIQNGKSYVVSIPNSFSPVMGTLRAFTTRKKNCYTFVNDDPGGIVLVRASFFYGNYDKKSSPPSFDIHFDGNYWATVQTSSTDVVYYEVAYTVKGSVLSVCFAQTKTGQFPFVSALEVRGLPKGFLQFADTDYPLFLRKRVAFGAKDIIRYPDDPYDRIWSPAKIVPGSGLNTVASNAIVISTTDAGDNPPTNVLLNAVIPANLSVTISLNLNLPSDPVPIYINTYFSEVSELASTDKRSFMIKIDNKDDNPGEPIIPPYRSVLEWATSNMTASSATSFSLEPTPDSTLPPLINAMEVYAVGGKLSKGTNSDDVGALASLQESFKVLDEWSGDPCLPSPYTWDWVTCSSDEVPRITALLLSGLGLVGTLPPDFSGMDALESIDMSKNSVTGEIPDFLGSLPKLKELNLANNNFDGAVPSTLSTNKNIKLDISGNPNLCKASDKNCKTTNTMPAEDSPGYSSSSYSSTTTPKKKKKVLPVVLGAGIPIFVVFWAIVGSLAVKSHRRKVAMAAGQDQMGAAGGKPGLMPTGMGPLKTSVPNVLNGFHQNQQEVPVYTEQDHQDAPADTGTQAYQASPAYGQDYTEVPLYSMPSDVESGNPTTQSHV